MADPIENPLVSLKPSETTLTFSLHPLVLLTASDLITRHRVRGEKGPLAGLLLGQQKGRETTAEHAFPVQVVQLDGGGWKLQQEWTETRIQQFKDVHKAPALDVVGWFTVCPESGPLPEHIGVQKQVTSEFSESSIFLAIHPSNLNPSETTNRKLPISTYESTFETDQTQDEGSMQVDGQENTTMKFRSVPFTIETDETEMIAIDYVAKGAGSAAAVEGTTAQTSSKVAESKGKQKDVKADQYIDEEPSTVNVLTTEEEDQLAGMTTRLNSVKMLQSRLQVLTTYIQSLPPSYLTDPDIPLNDSSPDPQHLSHLRSVQALLTRLSLLSPIVDHQQSSVLQQASQSQKNDVALVSMLSQLGHSVQGLSELGRKFATIETAKSTKSKGKSGFGQGPHGGTEEHDARVGGLTLNSGMLV